MTKVGVLDYGSGNLHSVTRALAAAGAEVVLASDAAEMQRCDRLVVPGVGAFAACVAGLNAGGGADIVRDWVAAERPLLGICVGHQVLFTSGDEHGVVTDGLGVLPGHVTRLAAHRLPHMGWNFIEAPSDSVLFAGVQRERFYFVHSYAVTDPPLDALVTTARHEDAPFVAAVERGAVASTQFHPEKSGAAGARLLRNWVDAA